MSSEIPVPAPAYVHPPQYPEGPETESPGAGSSKGSDLKDSRSHPVPTPPAGECAPLLEDHSAPRVSYTISIPDCQMSQNIRSAIHNQQYDVLALYFSQGFSPDHLTCLGNTPLFLAIRKGDLQMTKFILEKGARVNSWNSGLKEHSASEPNACYSGKHEQLRNFYLDTPADGDSKAFTQRIKAYQKELSKENWTPQCQYEREDRDVLYPSRTPLMEAAVYGRLTIVRLLVEQYGADPGLVAPDGQTAFRIAKDAGYRDVADYLPANRKGVMRRIKFRSRKSIRKIKEFCKDIYEYSEFFVWHVPKFFIWHIPKWFLTSIWEVIREIDGEKLKKFAKWVFIDVPRFFLWDVPKFFLWDLPKEIPSILRTLGKWAWKALTVYLPAFIKALGRTVSIASAIHSLFMAIATFLGNVTLQDVLRAFKEALNAIFMQLPLLVWRGIKGVAKAIDKLFCSLFDIFWWIGKVLVRIILFVPETIGRIVLEMGSLAGKVGREIVLLINPRF
ncbi:ankyrin [Gymnopus androsaceus JB14]|uniref:Ankyrin n=1 Tax=Gymnopus androsaceus JB14 TaxID=1447944 RepID=A0A6A4GZM7_9AGAR|nr:ankyrin [Gymnopus androsaceus JB14]